MALQDRLVTLAAKIIQVISLKNVAIWSLAALVGLMGFTIFENRGLLINYIINGPEIDAPVANSFLISEASRRRIKQLMESDNLINSIVVLNADIRNNRRIPIYWYSADLSIQKSLDGLFNGRYGGIPLFTSDEKNNENIVSLINGEFSCGGYESSGNQTIFPSMGSRFSHVCRISLPPYYGHFSGYITFTLNRSPNTGELDALKADAINISTEIYLRDILPTIKKTLNTQL